MTFKQSYNIRTREEGDSSCKTFLFSASISLRHLQLVGRHDTPHHKHTHTHTHTHTPHFKASCWQSSSKKTQGNCYPLTSLPSSYCLCSPSLPCPGSSKSHKGLRSLSGRYSLRKELWEGISNILDYTQHPECKLQTSHQEVI